MKKKKVDIWDLSRNKIRYYGKGFCYDLATALLYLLENEHNYCIWQSYTKENLKANLGVKKLSKDMFEEYGARLRDFDLINF